MEKIASAIDSLKSSVSHFIHGNVDYEDFCSVSSLRAIDNELMPQSTSSEKPKGKLLCLDCEEKRDAKLQKVQKFWEKLTDRILVERSETAQLNEWEYIFFFDITSACLNSLYTKDIEFKNHSLLHSTWQKLHTGHWSKVPREFRLFFTWTSVTLVDLLLTELQDSLNHSSLEIIKSKILKIIQICDRGLLMGMPLLNSPLTNVAHCFNEVIMEEKVDKEIVSFPNIPFSRTFGLAQMGEINYFPLAKELDKCELPSLHSFLLNYMQKSKPLKVLGIASSWSALEKWDFNYFRKVAGCRTVPVEIGLRYSDSDWSQTLLTAEEYLTKYCKNEKGISDNGDRAYLAQHQLFDQIPELLDDFFIPDYCRTGDSDPVLNAWIGPSGTVTPLHYDPDHNILVQVHGFKLLLLIPESDTEYIYPFEDDLLKNTSKVNLDESSISGDAMVKWPLLRKAHGYYLILSPGEAVYIPPRWWHYVKSLSNSISISFWWK